MANSDRPNGLRPKGPVKRSEIFTAGATVYPGDAVNLQGDGYVDPAAANEDILGVALQYAAEGDKVLVSVDPNQLYIIQADEDDIDADADIGQTADIVATAGSSTYRSSRHELDSSTIGSGAQLVILGYEDRVDNSLGEFVDAIVKINENQIFGETDSSGV